MEAIIAEILRCPVCKSELKKDTSRNFTCQDCKRSFFTNNGVPDFVIYDNEATGNNLSNVVR